MKNLSLLTLLCILTSTTIKGQLFGSPYKYSQFNYFRLGKEIDCKKAIKYAVFDFKKLAESTIEVTFKIDNDGNWRNYPSTSGTYATATYLLSKNELGLYTNEAEYLLSDSYQHRLTYIKFTNDSLVNVAFYYFEPTMPRGKIELAYLSGVFTKNRERAEKESKSDYSKEILEMDKIIVERIVGKREEILKNSKNEFTYSMKSIIEAVNTDQMEKKEVFSSIKKQNDIEDKNELLKLFCLSNDYEVYMTQDAIPLYKFKTFAALIHNKTDNICYLHVFYWGYKYLGGGNYNKNGAYFIKESGDMVRAHSKFKYKNSKNEVLEYFYDFEKMNTDDGGSRMKKIVQLNCDLTK